MGNYPLENKCVHCSAKKEYLIVARTNTNKQIKQKTKKTKQTNKYEKKILSLVMYIKKYSE